MNEHDTPRNTPRVNDRHIDGALEQLEDLLVQYPDDRSHILTKILQLVIHYS